MSKTISITLGDDLYKKLKSRAEKQYLEVSELIEDIVRRSMLSYKKISAATRKVDDALIPVFSRERRRRKKR
ncbi:ribbon-helix-helix protein, CopG family [Candidatus Pacearchaeota archaeon]|nr:ribbon-helix-helix protein, CopG family [Candidatus Pacearchaeota archaeon]